MIDNEPGGIIDPDRPIIDTHHHLFLRPALRYLTDEFAQDIASGHSIAASVYVEAGGFIGSGGFWREDGPAHLRPLGEIEFANGVGAMGSGGHFGLSRPCAVLVGHADLSQGDRIAELLDRCLSAAPDRYRGVRQPALHHPNPAAPPGLASRPVRGLLGSSAFREGFSHLGPRNLSFDVAVYHTQFDEVAELADAFPHTRLILNHLGMIFGYATGAAVDNDLRSQWRSGLQMLAQRPNVFCKLSGLGMPLWGFGFAGADPHAPVSALVKAWRPLVATALEIFGAERCMAGSNYPIDAPTVTYADLWNALKIVVSDCSEQEKTAIFFETAVATYRIEVPERIR